MKQCAKYIIIFLMFTLFSGCGVEKEQPEEKLPVQHIILITVDTLRADHLGCYGYPTSVSPEIDSLSRHSTLFRRCVTSVPKTGPSLAGLLTSTIPGRHLVYFNEQIISESLETLAERLHAKGYYCGGIQVNEIARAECGFSRGFDVYIQTNRPGENHCPSDRIRDVNNIVKSWVKQHSQEPFFLWVHYLDPHGPYTPPEPFSRMFSPGEYHTAAKTVPIKPGMKGFGGIPGYQAVIGSNNPGKYMAEYDGEIRSWDSAFREILNTAAELHIDSDLLLILSADHGESLGEHNYYFEHGGFLYEPCLHVPLIVHVGKALSRKNLISGQVSLLDIAPTILAFADCLPLREGIGTSLTPWLTNPGRSAPDLPVLIRSSEKKLARFAATGFTDSKWKYIIHTSDSKLENEVYDLDSDPGERNNLFHSISAEWKAGIAARMKRLEPVIPEGLRKPKASPRLLGPAGLQLKALGYIRE